MDINILDCVPPNITLRDVQAKALLWFAEQYEKNKFIIINMPVASGKSIAAMTICEYIKRKYAQKTAIITPTKILQDQYGNDFDWIPMLKGMGSYTCMATPAGNCATTKRMFEKLCGPSCGYIQTKAKCQETSTSIYNFHSYYYNEMFKQNLIIDEGHNAAAFLFDMFSVKLWQPELGYDPEIEPTAENVLTILGKASEDTAEKLALALAKKMDREAEALESLLRQYSNVSECLAKWGKDTLIVKKEEEYKSTKGKKELKNSKQILLNIKPLKVSAFSNILWPSDITNKIIMLSATIGHNDAAELGIDNFAYYESVSPIPKERRPFVAYPVASMNYAQQQESMPAVIDAILKIANRHPNDKGIIHCTYGVAKELEKRLFRNNRFLFHDNINKVQKYQEFKSSKSNQVLVASGMSEGIDLPDDAARWQIITKVQYPSLADDVNQWRCYNAKDLYLWDTVRTIIQQSGRICRNPTDFGITYMIDKEFDSLWRKTPKMWPEWFKESVIFVSV